MGLRKFWDVETTIDLEWVNKDNLRKEIISKFVRKGGIARKSRD